MVSVAADRAGSALAVPPVRDIGRLPGGGVFDYGGRAQLEANGCILIAVGGPIN